MATTASRARAGSIRARVSRVRRAAEHRMRSGKGRHAQDTGRSAAPRGGRVRSGAVEIGQPRLRPARLGVPQQEKGLHGSVRSRWIHPARGIFLQAGKSVNRHAVNDGVAISRLRAEPLRGADDRSRI